MEITESIVRDVLNTLNRGSAVFEPLTWREISRLPRFRGIQFATINGHANGKPIRNAKHRMIYGLPALVKIPPCPTCGDAPSVCLCDGTKTYDPTTERVTAKPGTGRQRHRAEIYPGTAPADVIAKLAALGHYVEYRKELA